MRKNTITTFKSGSLTTDAPAEKKSQNIDHKVKFEKPRVLRIRRVVAAGGHKG